jgi:RimJ/RimL family protein N-acetyltransferase
MRLTLRPATEEDVRFVWEVNNERTVRAQSISTEPIPWEDHRRWFADALERDDRKLYIAEVDEDRCGVVRFDLEDAEATISIALSPDVRGRGLGTQTIDKGSQMLCERGDAKRILAFVRPDNVASVKAFERAGFEFRETTRQSDVELNLYVREC